jgi:CheY-like chemotaxis protein
MSCRPALEHRPDVALLDIGLPGTDGITAAAELAARLPACRVLILTGMAAPVALAAALRAGVSGYLLKEDPAEDVLGAIRAVGPRGTDHRSPAPGAVVSPGRYGTHPPSRAGRRRPRAGEAAGAQARARSASRHPAGVPPSDRTGHPPAGWPVGRPQLVAWHRGWPGRGLCRRPSCPTWHRCVPPRSAWQAIRPRRKTWWSRRSSGRMRRSPRPGSATDAAGCGTGWVTASCPGWRTSNRRGDSAGDTAAGAGAPPPVNGAAGQRGGRSTGRPVNGAALITAGGRSGRECRRPPSRRTPAVPPPADTPRRPGGGGGRRRPGRPVPSAARDLAAE